MPHPPTHPRALFSLKPLNNEAIGIVNHPRNAYLFSTLVDGTYVLDVGHRDSRSDSRTTLATIGRNGDIYVGNSTIAKVQCSFEVHPDTGVVMFYDRSHNMSSQVFGENATPFESTRPRKVAVHKYANTIIGMGGATRDLISFGLIWHYDHVCLLEEVKNRRIDPAGGHPDLTRTMSETDTVLPSQMEPRLHTRGFQPLQIRYTEINKLGSGSYGTVHRILDMDTGKLLAVKVLTPPVGSETAKSLNVLKREIETLSRLKHPHIVDYLGFHDWDEVNVKIFMGAKQGTLQSLVEGGHVSVDITQFGRTVLHQMLQALDFLATHDIIHRDVKPENILYDVIQSGGYCFQLGDFGLCNRASIASTHVGSPLYMAPEISERGKQTHKVDVWSLFVTMLWTLDTRGFRQQSNEFRTAAEAQRAVLWMAGEMPGIREMAEYNPEKRASAAQMLIKHFGGNGLSTRQYQVPTLGSAQTNTEAPCPASNTTWMSQKQFGEQENLQNWASSLDQYRADASRRFT